MKEETTISKDRNAKITLKDEPDYLN